MKSSDLGKRFKVQLDNGVEEMECVKHEADHRVLKNENGWLELDWMEWLEQVGWGRIEEVVNP